MIPQYNEDGDLNHIEYCPICDLEAEYTTPPDALVAVRCPNTAEDGTQCEGILIHCDVCLHEEAPWGRGERAKCGTDCPWVPEACPESGAIVYIHEDRQEDSKALCPCGCGQEWTVKEHRESWE